MGTQLRDQCANGGAAQRLAPELRGKRVVQQHDIPVRDPRRELPDQPFAQPPSQRIPGTPAPTDQDQPGRARGDPQRRGGEPIGRSKEWTARDPEPLQAADAVSHQRPRALNGHHRRPRMPFAMQRDGMSALAQRRNQLGVGARLLTNDEKGSTLVAERGQDVRRGTRVRSIVEGQGHHLGADGARAAERRSQRLTAQAEQPEYKEPNHDQDHAAFGPSGCVIKPNIQPCHEPHRGYWDMQPTRPP